MSVRAMAWVFYDSAARGIERFVLLAIADHVHEDGRDSYPSIETLAHKCGVGKATVIRAIRSLEKLGELEVERRGRGRGRIQTYRVVMEKRSGADLFEAAGNGRPQVASYPQASYPQAEKVQKRSAGVTEKGPPRARGMENRITEPEPPARARAKSANPQAPSTASVPAYSHTDNAGHDPDPNHCAACGTGSGHGTHGTPGKPAVPEHLKRSWRDQLGVPWPDGPAPPPPIDEDAERARQIAELANLEHPEAFPKRPPENRRL